MIVLHVSAECYPMAKAGGLGDVVGALPKYQKKMGDESMVVMPMYDNQIFNTDAPEFWGVGDLSNDKISAKSNAENEQWGVITVQLPALAAIVLK